MLKYGAQQNLVSLLQQSSHYEKCDIKENFFVLTENNFGSSLVQLP